MLLDLVRRVLISGFIPFLSEFKSELTRNVFFTASVTSSVIVCRPAVVEIKTFSFYTEPFRLQTSDL